MTVYGLEALPVYLKREDGAVRRRRRRNQKAASDCLAGAVTCRCMSTACFDRGPRHKIEGVMEPVLAMVYA